VTEQLFELTPQGEVFQFPRMSVEMPKSALLENLIEEHFPEFDPVSRTA
jgi:hypothetical protein